MESPDVLPHRRRCGQVGAVLAGRNRWPRIRDAFLQSSADDWLRLDGLMVLMRHPHIRIKLVHGDPERGVSGLPPPHADSEAFEFTYELWSREGLVREFRMVQATRAIAFPVPHRRRGQLCLTEAEYHLAELACLSKTELDRFLVEAKIFVDR